MIHHTHSKSQKQTVRPPRSWRVAVVILGWLLASSTLEMAPVEAVTSVSAAFPMGADVTGQLDLLAGPQGSEAIKDLASLNVAWVRFEFKATDPTNLKLYDLAISRLHSQGLHVLAVLVDPWESCQLDTRLKDVPGFVQWVRQVFLAGCGNNTSGSVHQLGFDELTARYPFIQYWQIWNEPNVCGFLQTDLDDCGYGLWRRDEVGGERVNVRYGMQKFGALMATVYSERANKNVKLVTGGILNAYNCSNEFDPTCTNPGLENCYKLLPWDKFGCDAGTNLFINSDAVQAFKQANNGQLPFDVLGLHPYEPAAWSNGYVPPALYVTQDIQRNVRRFVDSKYPIWITEWGFNLTGNPGQIAACKYPNPSTAVADCEENVATLLDSLVNGINVRRDLNINNAFWFNLADGDARLQAGLIDPAGRKRPVWYHFQAAARAYGQPSQQSFQKEYLKSLLNNTTVAVTPGSAGVTAVPASSPAATETPVPPPASRDFITQFYDILNLILK